MAKEHLSIRLDTSTASSLAELAEQKSALKTNLAELYIGEGIRMERHPGIVFVNTPVGRRPVLAGRRLYVSDLVKTARDNSGSLEAAAKYLGVELHLVQTAVNYYADFRDEIDAWIEQDEQAFEQGLDRQRRAVEALSASAAG